MSTPDTTQPETPTEAEVAKRPVFAQIEPTAWADCCGRGPSCSSIAETPTEEPDFLAGTAACSLNPDDEGCESCQ